MATDEYQGQTRIPGLVCGTTSLAANQYKFVKFGATAGQIAVASAKTDKIIGVLQNDPAAGEPAIVCAVGVSKVISSGSVTVGTLLTSNSTGQAADSSSANDRVCGFALAADSTATNIVRMFVNCGGNF